MVRRVRRSSLTRLTLGRNPTVGSRSAVEICGVRQPFILRRNIGELLELDAREIAFSERNQVHSLPCFDALYGCHFGR